MGLIDNIYPVLLGNIDSNGDYGSFNFGCFGNMPDVAIHDVKNKLTAHLERQALGAPLHLDRTVKSTCSDITAFQGGKVEGNLDQAMDVAANKILAMAKSHMATPVTYQQSKDAELTSVAEAYTV